MSDITIGAHVQLADVHAPFRLMPLLVGYDLTAGNAVCIDPSDGKVYPSTTNPTGLGGHFDGIVLQDTVGGDPVTIFQQGTRVRIVESGLTIGAFYWMSDTLGALSDAQLSAGEQPIAKAVSATDIIVVRMDKPAVDNTPE